MTADLPGALALIAANAALVILIFAVVWLLFLKSRDPTPIDAVWALGMVAAAAASFVLTGGGAPRRWLLLGLCALWGVRLGGYLLWRWRIHGPDRRYVRLFEKALAQRGWSFPVALLRMVILVQGPLLFIVCLPVQLGQLDGVTPLGPLALVGAVLAVAGVVLESVADLQLVRFKADPANAGRVLDRGLWRYTRHPNYFGDACVWWGLWLIAAETRPGLFAVAGPLFLTWTLMKWSGAPTVEYRMRKTKPEYAAYIARTSSFFPWWPRTAP